jgi:hypothetical protein
MSGLTLHRCPHDETLFAMLPRFDETALVGEYDRLHPVA